MPIKIPPGGWADDATDDRDRRIAELEAILREAINSRPPDHIVSDWFKRASDLLGN